MKVLFGWGITLFTTKVKFEIGKKFDGDGVWNWESQLDNFFFVKLCHSKGGHGVVLIGQPFE